MNHWFRFFFGTPRRFVTTLAVIGMVIVLIQPGPFGSCSETIGCRAVTSFRAGTRNRDRFRRASTDSFRKEVTRTCIRACIFFKERVPRTRLFCFP